MDKGICLKQDVLEGMLKDIESGKSDVKELQDLVKALTESSVANQDQMRALMQSMESLNTSVSMNQVQISGMIEETRGLLQLYRDIQGVGRMGGGVQKFLIWLTKWPIIVIGILALIDWLSGIGDKLKSPFS